MLGWAGSDLPSISKAFHMSPSLRLSRTSFFVHALLMSLGPHPKTHLHAASAVQADPLSSLLCLLVLPPRVIVLVVHSQIGTAKQQVPGSTFCKDKLLGLFADPKDRGCWYTCTFFTGTRACCSGAFPCYFEPLPLLPLGFCAVSSVRLSSITRLRQELLHAHHIKVVVRL